MCVCEYIVHGKEIYYFAIPCVAYITSINMN